MIARSVSSLFALTLGLLASLTLNSSPARAASPDTSKVPRPEEDFIKQGTGMFDNYAKFIVLIDDSGKLGDVQFQNLNKFDRHSDLLRTLPQFEGMSIQQLDNLSYRANPVRKVLLGVLNMRCADDAICWNNFNLVSEDIPRAEHIIAVFKALNRDDVVENRKFAALKFQPLPHQTSAVIAMSAILAKAGVSITTPEVTPQRMAYTDAWNLGRLLWVESQEDLDQHIQKGDIGERTILVSEQALRDFPPVAGVISGTPLTPASHAVLLAQMYSIPVVYIKDAGKAYKSASGQLAYLSGVKAPGSSQSQSIVNIAIGITEQDVKRSLEFKPSRSLKVKLDASELRVRSARELGLADVGAYGGKASQIGLLMKTVPELTVPEAAAVPIGIYRAFMAKAKASTGEPLSAYVTKRLAEIPDGQEASSSAARILADVRQQIEKAEIPADIATQIRGPLEKLFPGDKIRLKLRSSSNVEDGAEFNGAGLYDSKGAWLKNPEKPQDLEKTIKQVWASLYTDRGYIARRRFHVDESMVGMGVAVHTTFKGEIYNGVSTLYVAPDQSSSFECITQIGEDLVTHAEADQESEQVTISYDKLEVEQPFKGYSKTRTLMASQDYFKLRDAMVKLSSHYLKKSGEAHIEIEWKLMPGAKTNDTQLIIKQVRAVPRPPAQKAADGSSFYVLSSTKADLGPVMQPSLNFAALLSPHRMVLTVPGMSEAELRSGSAAIQQLDYDYEDERQMQTNLPLKLETNQYNTTSISASLRHPFLKTARIKFELSQSTQPIVSFTGIGIYTTIETAASDVAWLKGVYGDLSDFTVALGAPGDSFANPNTVENGKSLITVKGAMPLSISLEQIKERGEGDNRETLIGQALVSGLLNRPLRVGGLLVSATARTITKVGKTTSSISSWISH